MAISVFKVSGGDSGTGIDYGKNLISVYRRNAYGTGNANSGAYNEEYFSFSQGVFTCKKRCNVAIFAVSGAVIGNSETSVVVYRDGSAITSISKNGGNTLTNQEMNIGSTLRFSVTAERASGSGAFSVYLNE